MMRTTLFPAVLLLLAAAIPGCGSSGPTAEQIASADYGAFPENYIEVAKQWMVDTYGPPATSGVADLHIERPVKGYQTGGIFNRSEAAFGYESLVTFTLQTTSGRRMTRTKQGVLLLIHDGKVVSYKEQRQ